MRYPLRQLMKRRAAVPARSTARQLATRPPLRRLFWALGRLRSGRALKATDLAAEFEVNVRTAYRDLDFLRDEWRVPLEFDRPQRQLPADRAPGRPPARDPEPGRARRPSTSPRRCWSSTAARPFEPDLDERVPEDPGAAPEGRAGLAGEPGRLPVASIRARSTRPTPRSSATCWPRSAPPPQGPRPLQQPQQQPHARSAASTRTTSSTTAATGTWPPGTSRARRCASSPSIGCGA